MWRDQPMCGFDLETTGTDVETDRIVTAAVVLTHGLSQTWLADPGVEIPEGATSVHGITTATARREGRPAAEVASEVRDSLAQAWSMGMPVVGHNIVFDLTLLDRECRRHGHGPLDIAGPVIDTLVIDKHVDRYRKGSRRLEDMAAHYRVRLDAAHDAREDVLAACRIAWRLASIVIDGTALGDVDLAALTGLQATWYREQRESFAAYRRAKGQPLDDESTDWPLRPYVAQGVAA